MKFHSVFQHVKIQKNQKPTGVLLQDPALQFYDGVSEGAAVLSLAPVSDLVATHIKLAERVQGTHLTVAHVG